LIEIWDETKLEYTFKHKNWVEKFYSQFDPWMSWAVSLSELQRLQKHPQMYLSVSYFGS
jgi:hypothetical protein